MKRKKWIILFIALVSWGLLLPSFNKKERAVSLIKSKQKIANKLFSFRTNSLEKEVYFGDLHLHTTRSVDASYGVNYNTPDDAYRYATGELVELAIQEADLLPIQLIRPLDFMAITDHSEYLGNWSYFEETRPNSVANSFTTNEDGSTGLGIINYIKWYFTSYFGNMDYSIYNEESVLSGWEEAVTLADQYYRPGEFTTFPAYEWTANLPRFLYAGNNHRNVIFASSFDLPSQPMSRHESNDNVNVLWDWMQNYRDETGMDVISIPHNMNISDGTFFKVQPNESIENLEKRNYNEPLLEVVQTKGQSMTHPFLSPNDEFANYSIREVGLLSISSLADLTGIPYTGSLGSVPPRNFRDSYVRNGLQRGLQVQQYKGVNPFKVGFVGSSDNHYAYSLIEEVENDRMNIISSGLAAVWAEENTRESIFRSLRDKETYATSGSRMKVRFFAGYDLPQNVNFGSSDWPLAAYEGGVPMGGDLGRRGNEAPGFIVYALKDAMSASLDRIQIIKVWVDPELEQQRQEKIYNVDWAGQRMLENDGSLTALIDTSENFDWTNYAHDEVGTNELYAEWEDPEFNPELHAAYYVRVLETINMFHRRQERAWTSPIYYNPDVNELITSDIETELFKGFSVYPNPVLANQSFNIIVPRDYQVESVTLATMSGQQIGQLNWRTQTGNIIVETKGLQAGVYLLTINGVGCQQVVIQ